MVFCSVHVLIKAYPGCGEANPGKSEALANPGSASLHPGYIRKINLIFQIMNRPLVLLVSVLFVANFFHPIAWYLVILNKQDLQV